MILARRQQRAHAYELSHGRVLAPDTFVSYGILFSSF